MDETVTPLQRLACVACAICGTAALALSTPAFGESSRPLVDPTRPAVAGGIAGAAASAAGAATPPELQSIIVGPGRREAVISGQTVKQGDRYGDARVTKITETEVQLRSGTHVQTLRLFPALQKRRPEAAAGVRPPRRSD
ncbi:MAG TPA: hypothetical protein VIM12_06890 [Noviherbaspirillum sp.]|jgi:MSHA biogenesis protein MshK|uniref:hypothetical protein n=1 Tax=Noviherbaspirillum sp. TaxID=1926288 RepID=UPI002F93450E